MTVQPGGQGTRIRSVLRASQLLLLMATLSEEDRTVHRLAEQLGTSVPMVYHLLNTLVDAQLLARDDRKHYVLGLSVGVLSAAYAAQSVPPPELLRPLESIVEATGETAYLSAWRRGQPIVLARRHGTHAVQVTNLRPGCHEAAHARASGKVLLAFGDAGRRDEYLAGRSLQQFTPQTITDLVAVQQELRAVCARAYATEVEEVSPGVACIAVPVFTNGLLLGAYTISTPVERYRQHADRYVAALRDAAAQPSQLPLPHDGERRRVHADGPENSTTPGGTR